MNIANADRCRYVALTYLSKISSIVPGELPEFQSDIHPQFRTLLRDTSGIHAIDSFSQKTGSCTGL